MEQRVGVGDKLQLSVQVGQARAGKGHARLPVASHLHAVHVRGHVQRPQSGGDVDLRVEVGGVSGMTAASEATCCSPHRVLLPLMAVVQGQACREEADYLFTLKNYKFKMKNKTLKKITEFGNMR